MFCFVISVTEMSCGRENNGSNALTSSIVPIDFFEEPEQNDVTFYLPISYNKIAVWNMPSDITVINILSNKTRN